MASERKGKVLVFCYGTGDENGGLDLEEQKDRSRSAVSLSAALAGEVCGLTGGAYWFGGLR